MKNRIAVVDSVHIATLAVAKLVEMGHQAAIITPDQAKELQKPIIITPSGLQASINTHILNTELLLQGY